MPGRWLKDMRDHLSALILLACSGLAPGTAQAADRVRPTEGSPLTNQDLGGASAADDVRAGHILSLKLCTPCHLVEPGQEMTPILRPPAPPFRSIANRPGMTAESLRHFLSDSHRSFDRLGDMPNAQLTDDQVRQAAAFVISLRKP